MKNWLFISAIIYIYLFINIYRYRYIDSHMFCCSGEKTYGAAEHMGISNLTEKRVKDI